MEALHRVLIEVNSGFRIRTFQFPCFHQLWGCFETYLNQIFCCGTKSRQFTHFNHTQKSLRKSEPKNTHIA